MLRYAGFSASPVSVDSEGMQPEKLEQALNPGRAGSNLNAARTQPYRL